MIFISNLSKKQLISLVSLLIILISLPLAIFLVQQQQVYQGRAVAPEARPTNVKITNLHGGGFSVSWTSSSPTNDNSFVPTTGWIKYGTTNNNLNQKVYDDRGGENFSSTTHHASIFNLQPETTYYFKIQSGPDLYGLNVAGTKWVKGGIAKQQVTPITLDPTGNPHPIYGFIKNQAGNTIEGVLVYTKFKKDDSETKSALMSTVTKSDEGWVMDAKNARMENLTSFFGFDDNDRVLIDTQAGQNGIASADFALSNSSPASDITVTPQATYSCSGCSSNYDRCWATWTSTKEDCSDAVGGWGTVNYSVNCSCPVVGNSNCPGGDTSVCRQISMYYCKTANWQCVRTSSLYPNTSAGITQCQTNLGLYLPGQTTGICYSSLSACQSACTPTRRPTATPTPIRGRR